MDDNTQALTIAQAAALLGVAPNSVILWADAGILQSWRTPLGHRRITAASVQAMLDNRHARESANRVRALRVMVVEDDVEMAAMLAEQIRDLLPSSLVTVLGDGFVALMQAGRDLPDVILMDVNLPGINGLAMIKSLRSQAATERLRFILVSSALPHELQSFGEVPADVPYLCKPVAREALVEALGLVLDR